MGGHALAEFCGGLVISFFEGAQEVGEVAVARLEASLSDRCAVLQGTGGIGQPAGDKIFAEAHLSIFRKNGRKILGRNVQLCGNRLQG